MIKAKGRSALRWLLFGGIGGCLCAVASLSTTQPALRVEPSSVEIESISPGITEERIVKLYNNRKAPLKITSIASTCGCSSATVASTELPPNDFLEIRISVKGQLGMETGQIAKVAIVTNDPNYPSIVFPVIVRYVSGFIVVPNVVDFGVVERSALPATKRIYVTGSAHSGDKLSVSLSASWISHVRQKFDDTRKEWAIDLQLEETVPEGSATAQVKICVENGVGTPKFERTISALTIVR